MKQPGFLRESPPIEVQVDDPAVWVRRGTAPYMSRAHRHDDLEINYVIRGRLDYIFGGTPLGVRAGQIAVFWGLTPHRLVETEAEGCDCRWVHVPLATVFGWALPHEHLRQLLTSHPIVLPAEAAGRDLQSMFDSWMSDLTSRDREQFAMLEVQALLLRLLGSRAYPRCVSRVQEPETTDRRAHTSTSWWPNNGMEHVVEMARFVTTNFRSQISVADVAEATHLNPNYAMALFREGVGTTLGAYISRCRITEAQRLLLATTMTMTQIATAAGFGSQSSFYAHFARVCGVSPNAYRRSNSSAV